MANSFGNVAYLISHPANRPNPLHPLFGEIKAPFKRQMVTSGYGFTDSWLL
jgi:hypothetical protein